MKLWKSKKSISCVPGKNATLKKEEKNDANGIPLAPLVSDRAMSPAQSEDSGLAPDRGTTYATITLPRDNALNMGITFAERNDLSYPPVIGALSPLGHAADFLAPGDRIHQIDGISTIGLTNQHIMSMLCNGSGSNAGGGVGGDASGNTAVVEIEYSLPEYISQNSLCVTSKLAQITVERESGCLGLTLRGGGDFPLVVTHVRPHGPVYKTGRIKPGDRLLRVDNVSLIGKTLAEAQQIIKCGGHISGYANLTIEYDVSVVQSVEFSMGPLLIEIERPMNDKLGLVLCNYTSSLHNDHMKIDEVSKATIYIASILPASIADRCGALSVGDQVLSIDDTVIEGSAYTPDEVMNLLDASTGRGYTQMQIMPAHALARRGHSTLGSPKYGFSTLESRKSRQRLRYARKSSLPLESVGGGGAVSTGAVEGSCSSGSGPGSSTSGGSSGSNSNSVGGTGSMHCATNLGSGRTERFSTLLDCTFGSGIVLGSEALAGHGGNGFRIMQIMPDSPADRCGCIQIGDRLVAVNKMSNMCAQEMRSLLSGYGPCSRPQRRMNWVVELLLEFDLPDTVVPASGVFNVPVRRSGQAGLGISVKLSANQGAFIIIFVQPGGITHRTGSVRKGDFLLAVDAKPLLKYDVEMLLNEGVSNEYTILTIKRDILPDYLAEAQRSFPTHIYGNSCVTPTTTHDVYSSAFIKPKYVEYSETQGNVCGAMRSITSQTEDVTCAIEEQASLEPVEMGQQSSNSSCGTDGSSLLSLESKNIIGSSHRNANDNAVESMQLRHPTSSNHRSPEECSVQMYMQSYTAKSKGHRSTDENGDEYVQMRHHASNGHRTSDETGEERFVKRQQFVNSFHHSPQSQTDRQCGGNESKSLTKEQPDEGNTVRDFKGYDLERYASVDCTTLPPPMENKVYGSAASSSSKSSGSSIQQIIFSVRLEPRGGLLGITLAGSEDVSKPITISSIVAGGIAHKNGQIQVGDQLLAINNVSMHGIPLSGATTFLQNLGDLVDFKLLRTHDGLNNNNSDAANRPEPQAIYAQVQRQPRSPSANTDNGSANDQEAKYRIFHVALRKDKVYDDYGFSVSDGLYERGVFINRIRTGGPADMCGMLKPFDRIMQVNDMKTQDFDCCLTVPLIAAAGDKIELIIQRAE